MREDLQAALERTGTRPGRRALDAVQRLLREDEAIIASTTGHIPNADVVALLTDRRLLVGGGADVAYPLDRLLGAVTYQSGAETVFRPLLADDAGEPFFVPAGEGVRFAETVRNRLIDSRGPAAAEAPIWLDPSFTSVVRLTKCGLLAAPSDCGVETRAWLTATLTSIGVSLRSNENSDRHFIPWNVVHGVRIEGVDQVTNRPSVGAVVAFGVLGLAARRTERRAFVTFETTNGDYLLENDEHLPVEFRALAAPFLDRLGIAEAPSVADAVDPIDQIRRLGELRDAGYVTAEQFEAKRAQLLDRI